MDAVVRTGGKQYRVRAGSVLSVATLDAQPGSTVELRDVLLVNDGDSVTVGSPTVPDAVVVAQVLEHGKGRKVVNFKYKAKVRYRRKRGHRQGYTRLEVSEIRLGEKRAESPRRRAAEPEAAAASGATASRRRARPPEGFAGRAEEAPAPSPAPRRRRRSETEPEGETEGSTQE